MLLEFGEITLKLTSQKMVGSKLIHKEYVETKL